MELEKVNRLQELEFIIRENVTAFYRVGRALMEIRDNRLYLAKNGGAYETFEAYCKGEWDFSARHAERLMGSAKVIENTRPIGRIPESESQCRPLTKLEPEQQAEVWQKAVETAPEGKVTAAHISKTVKSLIETPIKTALKQKPKIDKEEIMSEEFKKAFDLFFIAIKNAKALKWKTTSKEAVLQRLSILHDIATIS